MVLADLSAGEVGVENVASTGGARQEAPHSCRGAGQRGIAEAAGKVAIITSNLCAQSNQIFY